MSVKSVDGAIVTLTSWIVVYLTFQMTVVVILGVFMRYVMNDAYAWVEEVARYSMIWLSWLGGGLAIRRGAHIAVEFGIDALAADVRRAVLFAGRLAIFGFLGVCIWFGADLTDRVSMQSTIALGISMQIPYASIPIGAALMAYHLLVVMIFPWARVERASTEFQL